MTAQAMTKEEVIKPNGVAQALAERLGATARTVKIYGEPIERDGATVIPVSKIVYGFGGGSGEEKETDGETESGQGGGGGLVASPIGYIEMRNGETRFRPIFDAAILIPLAATGSIAVAALAWGVVKMTRAMGKGE